jgi:hypothetical protein
VRIRVAFAGLGALASAGAGIGILFALQAPNAPPCVPKSRDAIFDRARALGIIRCYRYLAYPQSYRYDETAVLDGGDVMVRVLSSAGGDSSTWVYRSPSGIRRAGEIARVIHRYVAFPHLVLAPVGDFPYRSPSG